MICDIMMVVIVICDGDCDDGEDMVNVIMVNVMMVMVIVIT